jgi:hypothetical protein
MLKATALHGDWLQAASLTTRLRKLILKDKFYTLALAKFIIYNLLIKYTSLSYQKAFIT